MMIRLLSFFLLTGLLVCPAHCGSRIRNKVAGVWDEVAKMPVENTCAFNFLSRIDDDNKLSDIRVEIFKEEFLKKLGLKERPAILDSDYSVTVPSGLRQLLYNTLNLSSAVGDEEGDEEKVIVIPKGYAVWSGAVDMKFEVPAHLQAEEIKSAVIWIRPRSQYQRGSAPQSVDFIAENCDVTVQKPHRMTVPFLYKDGWVHIDVTWQLKNWLEYRQLCYNIKVSYEVKSGEAFFSTESQYNPFMLAKVEKSTKPDRNKRNTDCSHSNTECCRDNLTISFSEIRWNDWIIHPPVYNAYYCKGTCSRAASITSKTYYTLIEKKKILLHEKGRKHLSIRPCCVPTKFSPMSVAYKVNKNIAITKIIPDMIVENCECS